MTKDLWRKRLYDAILNSGKAPYEISLSAGLGQNYVEQLMKRDVAITVPVLLKICEVVEVSPDYLFSGVEISKDLRRLLDLEEVQDPKRIRALIDILSA